MKNNNENMHKLMDTEKMYTQNKSLSQNIYSPINFLYVLLDVQFVCPFYSKQINSLKLINQ